MSLIRQQTYYSGHVQGVGFRYTTLQCARAYAVTGYVRNLDDGRVELVVEGSEVDVQKLLSDIQERMDAHIQAIETGVCLASGEFSDFSIRH